MCYSTNISLSLSHTLKFICIVQIKDTKSSKSPVWPQNIWQRSRFQQQTQYNTPHGAAYPADGSAITNRPANRQTQSSLFYTHTQPNKWRPYNRWMAGWMDRCARPIYLIVQHRYVFLFTACIFNLHTTHTRTHTHMFT